MTTEITNPFEVALRRALVQAGLALMIGLLALDLVKLLVELYETDKTGYTTNLNRKAPIPAGEKAEVFAHE